MNELLGSVQVMSAIRVCGWQVNEWLKGGEGMANLFDVHDALCQFIIKATEEETPSSVVQTLPEVVRALVELSVVIRTQKQP
ncbi:MAG: hypothetical protein RIN56_13355 [Sporomusaceae bacterium]|nr:hypothetical protein [Sporomusaceae bacterium]